MSHLHLLAKLVTRTVHAPNKIVVRFDHRIYVRRRLEIFLELLPLRRNHEPEHVVLYVTERIQQTETQYPQLHHGDPIASALFGF